MRKGRLRHRTASGDRKDAKGSAAKSVRDRFPALLARHWQGTGCNPVVCFVSGMARNPCVKGQRDRRDQGTILRKPNMWTASVFSASSAILQRCSSRTQWPNGPAMTPLRLSCMKGQRALNYSLFGASLMSLKSLMSLISPRLFSWR